MVCWLGFGAVLFYANVIKRRKTLRELPVLGPVEQLAIIAVSVIGGILSALFGNGDICTFSYITLRYNLSEKVAVPTSVILMAGNAVAGFLLHTFALRDFGIMEMQYWLASIPVVCIGAPFGAYFISTKTRHFIAVLLYAIIAIQFVGACFVVRPAGSLLLTSIGIFFLAVCFFIILAGLTKPPLSKGNE